MIRLKMGNGKCTSIHWPRRKKFEVLLLHVRMERNLPMLSSSCSLIRSHLLFFDSLRKKVGFLFQLSFFYKMRNIYNYIIKCSLYSHCVMMESRFIQSKQQAAKEGSRW